MLLSLQCHSDKGIEPQVFKNERDDKLNMKQQKLPLGNIESRQRIIEKIFQGLNKMSRTALIMMKLSERDIDQLAHMLQLIKVMKDRQHILRMKSILIHILQVLDKKSTHLISW